MQPKFEPPPTRDPSDGFQAWLSRNWGFIAATALGAVVGGVIGVASAGTDTTTRTTTRAITETETTVAEVHTETSTETETVTEQAPSAPGDSTQSFSGGVGTRNLGTLEIPVDSTLEWTNDGALFQIFDDSLGITVSSLAPSGSTFLPAGTYSNVVVNALGSWTITISPD